MRAEAIVKLAELLGCAKVRAGRRSVVVTCPLAPWTHEGGQDRHPGCSIIIDPDRKSGWRCHGCGHHGNLNWLVTKWGTLSRKDVEAAFQLIEREEDGAEAVKARLDRTFDEKWAPVEPPTEPGEDPEIFPEAEAEQFGGRVPRYALDRGLSLETCKAWELGYDEGFGGKPTPRLVFPVRRRDGALVGLVGRATNGARPKYYNYWHFRKSRHLYGLDKVPADSDTLILVEGMIDTLVWWSYGLPVAGTMGAIPSKEQARLASEYRRVYVALDADAAGREGTEALLAMLQDRVAVYRCDLPEGKVDPKDCNANEAQAVVASARRVL